jgi:hypothetical protein
VSVPMTTTNPSNLPRNIWGSSAGVDEQHTGGH